MGDGDGDGVGEGFGGFTEPLGSSVLVVALLSAVFFGSAVGDSLRPVQAVKKKIPEIIIASTLVIFIRILRLSESSRFLRCLEIPLKSLI